MSDTNKIRYGIKSCYYAVATLAADGTATYGTPKALPGAVSLALSPQGETTPFYADNIAYYVSVSNAGYEGDLTLARVPETFLADVLGYIADGNGVLYEDANAAPVHFALMFQFEGDAHSKRVVLYNCTAQRPSDEHNTKEATIDPQTEAITITATSVHVSAVDKDVVRATATPTEATQYAAWFTAVYQPAAST